MPTAIDDILNETPTAAKAGDSASPYDDILAATPSAPKPKFPPAPPYLSDRPGPAQDFAGTIPGLRTTDAPPPPPKPPLPAGLSQPQTSLSKLRTLVSPTPAAATATPSTGQQATPRPAPPAQAPSSDSMNATISSRTPGLWETVTAPVREGAIGRAFGASTETAAARQEDPSNPLLRFEAMTPKPGIARGAAQFASGLTAPENLLFMAGTGGL